MGFEPVLDNHKNIKVRVEHTNDVQKILSAIKDAGAFVPRPGRPEAQP